MKEKTVFWLFSLVFAAACVIALLICDINRRADDVYIKEITVSESALASFAASGEAPSENISVSALVNINTASAEELTSLPGIGDAIAERIVKYRDENGGFDSIEELTEVSGIGKAKLEALKGLITV